MFTNVHSCLHYAQRGVLSPLQHDVLYAQLMDLLQHDSEYHSCDNPRQRDTRAHAEAEIAKSPQDAFTVSCALLAVSMMQHVMTCCYCSAALYCSIARCN
jgi:hypothetical protein